MNPTAAGLRITEHDGVSRVDFVDRNILDEANIQQIGDELSKLVEENRRRPRRWRDDAAPGNAIRPPRSPQGPGVCVLLSHLSVFT